MLFGWSIKQFQKAASYARQIGHPAAMSDDEVIRCFVEERVKALLAVRKCWTERRLDQPLDAVIEVEQIRKPREVVRWP